MPMTYNPKYNTYIGARYVPLVDGQWDNSKQYEPLTIVLYQGASYTSKTYVPVGVDILNETYWALTGDYNAQVQSIQEQVNKNTSDIAELQQGAGELPEQVQVNTAAIASLKEQVDGGIGRYTTRYDVYVSQSGSDNNPGTTESPFATADKAFELMNKVGGAGGALFVHFKDAGTYPVNKHVFAGTSLHIVGDAQDARLSFTSTSNIRFYATHINFENITIEAPNTRSFAVDGSSYWFVNCVFDIPVLNFVYAWGRLTNCTVNCINADTACVSMYGVSFSGSGHTNRIDGIRSTIDLRKINDLGDGAGMTLFYIRECTLYLAADLPPITGTKYENFLNTGYSQLWGSGNRYTGANAFANNKVASDTLSFYFLSTGFVTKYPGT